MNAVERIKPEDKFVSVDGLKLRYIEEGSGPSVLFLHGASLGSSADVFLRNLGPFAKAGFRAVAFDLPGFGLSDIPAKQSVRAATQFDPEIHRCRGLGQDRADRAFTLGRLRDSAGIGRPQPLFARRSFLAPARCCRCRPKRRSAGTKRYRRASTRRWRKRNRRWRMPANCCRRTPSTMP